MSGNIDKPEGGDLVDAKPTLKFTSKGSQAVPSKATCSKTDAVSNSFAYNMDYPQIGKCVIINNKNFHESTMMAERHGTDLDAKKLLELFNGLGFKCTVRQDQTVSKMKEYFRLVSQEDHSQSAMFVCVVLSHGDEDVIYGTDGCIKFKELAQMFRGDQCLSLVGKPKLFFIQACRGSNLDSGIETDSVSESESTKKIPVEADFLYAYSTAPGYYAWRNTGNGSWFISALCEVLTKYGRELEILQLMTRVNHKVAMDFQSSSTSPDFHGMKQIPCIVSMLTKELYFPK